MARIPDRPALRGAVVALLLVGLPYNLARLEATGVERFTLGSPEQVGAIVAAGDELGVPPDVEPQPHLMPGVTHGWLADQIADGLVLPRPGPDDPGLEAVRLAVALPTVDPATVPLASPAACTPLEPATPVRLDAGDVLVLDGTSATIRGEGGASMVLTPSSMAPTWTTW
jgi:hypothetical protein